MRYCSLLPVFLFIFSVVEAQNPAQVHFMIRNFEKQEYKAENQNWSVTQDQNGYIYAANNAGLLEYDGVDWSFYPSPNGAVLRSVAVDQNGRIYTSGYREIGYWERSPRGDLVYHGLNDLARDLFSRNEEFWNTVIIGDQVFFHSFTSVFIYDGSGFRVIRPGRLINSISDAGGRLCLDIPGNGLFMVEDTVLVSLMTNPEIEGLQVHFCLPMPDSGLLLGTADRGLYLLKDRRLRPYLEEWTGYFAENGINRGTITDAGQLVVGTLLDGIVIFSQEGDLLHRINHEKGLQNNTVLGIHSDAENNIWLGLDRGIDFISFHTDPSYVLFEYEEIGAVYSAAVFRGELYLCTNQGVFYRDWDHPEEAFRFIPETQGQAWSCNVYDDQLIVGLNNGTYRISDHVAERISEVSGGFSIVRDPLKPDFLVQSTYSNIVFYGLEDEKWEYNYQLSGFQDLIRYIQLDYYNNLWASHMHRGIYRLKLDEAHDSIRTTRYYGEEVFGKDYDIQVFKIGGRIVFSSGEQFFTYNEINDSIIPHEPLNRALGVHSSAHRVVPAGEMYYWFISNTHVGLFLISDQEISLVREYPAGLFRDHLVAGYENIIPLSPTEGLLCLDNGYALLRAGEQDLSSLIKDRKLVLKNIELQGRSGLTDQLPLDVSTLRIPYNRNSLDITFAFPFYTPGIYSFNSYMEGLDTGWSEPRSEPVFKFTRIPAGEYTLRVRAFNEWNKSSEESVISVLVAAPWYFSRVSFLVYLALLMGLLLIGRNILLERIRAREIRIKQSKEQELVRLRNEKLNAELSFKSQELANATMAIIKKNEFLLELKGTFKAQKDELGTRYPEKYYSRVVRKIDQNISSMDDWKVFEIHFEKAHEKFLQKLSAKYPHLSHSDLRLCAYLRMNLSSKEIAPLLRISYRGVENHRYRLRKKLHLKKEVNLTDFILSL